MPDTILGVWDISGSGGQLTQEENICLDGVKFMKKIY